MKMRPLLLALLFGGLFFSCSQNSNNHETQADSKKIFRYNQPEGLTSLDPAQAKNQANIWAISQVFNGLFEFTEDLSEIPSIAETWEISEDGKVYTINIKKGIYFQDSPVFPNGKGREVTAKDFVYSFKRILAPSTASTGSWIFNDKVKRDENGTISDDCFVADSRYSLKIYLEDAFPPFLQILAMPYAFVVPKEAIDKYGKDFRRNPVGTGPFFMESWDEGSSLVLKKNNTYWKKDHDHQRLPYLDGVQVSFISDKNQELLTFKQGKLHFISGVDDSTVDQILKKDGTTREDIAKDFVIQKIPQLHTEYLGFQLNAENYEDRNHPILNVKVRQALSFATNREELVAFRLNNLGDPETAGFVPSALPSHDKDKVTGYNYNPDKARELLKEAGYAGGQNFPELTLHTTPSNKAMAEELQKQWSSTLGINVNIETNNFATHQEMVDNGHVQFFRASWLGDYPDEENYLSSFYSENFSPKGPNKTHFKNKKFDDLFESVHLEKDGFTRHELYYNLDQLVMDNAAVIILYYGEVLRLTQKNVKGLTTNAMNTLYLEKVRLDNGGNAMASK